MSSLPYPPSQMSLCSSQTAPSLQLFQSFQEEFGKNKDLLKHCLTHRALFSHCWGTGLGRGGGNGRTEFHPEVLFPVSGAQFCSGVICRSKLGDKREKKQNLDAYSVGFFSAFWLQSPICLFLLIFQDLMKFEFWKLDCDSWWYYLRLCILSDLSV